MDRAVVVFVPSIGGGNWCYELKASSSYDAAWQAIQCHQQMLDKTRMDKLPDDAVVRVVIDGQTSSLYGYLEHNAQQPNYRHKVGKVKAWEN